MTEQPSEDDPFVRLWNDFLERDMERFRAMHQKARTDAGPSLIGGARSIDYWTYEWARRAVGFSLQEASEVILGYAEHMAERPDELAVRAWPGLRRQHERYFAELDGDFSGSPANEFDMRPSREALIEVKSYVRQRSERAMAAVSRGVIDEEFRRRPAWYSAIARHAGGSQRLLLYLTVAAFILAMWSTM